eukprot:6212662-Pleurochrysis_carterae.AAC.4
MIGVQALRICERCTRMYLTHPHASLAHASHEHTVNEHVLYIRACAYALHLHTVCGYAVHVQTPHTHGLHAHACMWSAHMLHAREFMHSQNAVHMHTCARVFTQHQHTHRALAR